MSYSYDSWGWLSDRIIPDRVTDAAPPAHGPRIVGDPYPNWTGTAWVLLPYAEPVAPTPEPVVEDKRITRLAFRNRFTFSERIAIEQAAGTDVQVRVLQKDMEAATWVDLSRQDTLQGLQLLASKGLITLARASEILNNPIQDLERPL